MCGKKNNSSARGREKHKVISLQKMDRVKMSTIRRIGVTRSGDGAFRIKGRKAESRGTDEDGGHGCIPFIFLSDSKSKRFS